MFGAMSNYGQQPPYGSNPYGPPQPGQQGQPGQYGQPGQQQPSYGQPNPYGQPQPYGQPGQPGQQPPQYGQRPAYGQPPQGPPPGQPNQWQPQPPAQPAAPPAPVKPTMARHALTVVTMDSVPGREIAGVVGEVLGVVARSREIPRDQRTGSPVDAYVSMLVTSRQDAVVRLVEMAEAAGADAVVGLRYDCSEITQSLSEVVAYGTAVTLVPELGPHGGLVDTTVEEHELDEHREHVATDEGMPDGETSVPTPESEHDQAQGEDQDRTRLVHHDQATETDPAATSPGQWPPPAQTWPPQR